MNAVSTRIETPRLVLRAPQTSDARDMVTAVRESLSDLKSWLPWANDHYDFDAARRNIITGQDLWEMEEEFSFVVLEKATNALIGKCSLQNREPSVPRVEIGYWQRSSACGKGFMTEAVRALTEEAFENLGVFRVEINCDPRNTKSANVARRAGFDLEAILKNDRRDHFGVLSGTLIFARVRPENP